MNPNGRFRSKKRSLGVLPLDGYENEHKLDPLRIGVHVRGQRSLADAKDFQKRPIRYLFHRPETPSAIKVMKLKSHTTIYRSKRVRFKLGSKGIQIKVSVISRHTSRVFFLVQTFRKRTKYSLVHQDKTIYDFWRFIFFTDEIHIDPSSQAQGYILREGGTRTNPENIQQRGKKTRVKLHISA